LEEWQKEKRQNTEQTKTANGILVANKNYMNQEKSEEISGSFGR